MDQQVQVLQQFLDAEREHVLGGHHARHAAAAARPALGEWGKRSTDLRFVMLHVLKVTACHAGHLDAVAELLDGRQWIVIGDR